MSDENYYLFVKIPKKSLILNLSGDTHLLEFFSNVLKKGGMDGTVEHIEKYKKNAKFTQKFTLFASDENIEILGRFTDEEGKEIEKTKLDKFIWYREGDFD